MERARRTRKTPRPVCTVVIRTYNEEKHIARLLAGIQSQSVPDAEILIVDSGSTDATLAIASRYPVRVLHIDPKAFSFGRSLNLGCREAKGEIIVIASAHVYPVYPDWLERMLGPFADGDVGLVYGKQRGHSSSKFSEHQIFRQWFPDASVKHQRTAFCNNANAAVRRRLWRRRPYDEGLPALEDVDWANWVLGEGFFLSYQAEAEIVHVHEESPRAVYNRYRREAMALKRIRPQEHFGLFDLARLFAAHVSLDLREAVRQGLAQRVAGEILWFRWMQFWGTYRGFQTPGPLTVQLKEAFYYPRSGPGAPPPPTRSVRPIDYAEMEQPRGGPSRTRKPLGRR